MAGAERLELSTRGFGDRCSTKLSYTPKRGRTQLFHTPPINEKVWWAIGDSNPGPTGYEPVALTN